MNSVVISAFGIFVPWRELAERESADGTYFDLHATEPLSVATARVIERYRADPPKGLRRILIGTKVDFDAVAAGVFCPTGEYAIPLVDNREPPGFRRWLLLQLEQAETAQ